VTHDSVIHSWYAHACMCVHVFTRVVAVECIEVRDRALGGAVWRVQSRSGEMGVECTFARSRTISKRIACAQWRPDTTGDYVTSYLFLASFVISTLYTYIWDVTMDWSLGRLRYGGVVSRVLCRNTSSCLV
jgi:hypothetical protein